MLLTFSGNTVADLKRHLVTIYPRLLDLNSFFIAVDQEYAQDSVILNEASEIALIPPVSGG